MIIRNTETWLRMILQPCPEQIWISRCEKLLFYVGIEFKTRRYIKPNIAVGKTIDKLLLCSGTVVHEVSHKQRGVTPLWFNTTHTQSTPLFLYSTAVQTQLSSPVTFSSKSYFNKRLVCNFKRSTALCRNSMPWRSIGPSWAGQLTEGIG